MNTLDQFKNYINSAFAGVQNISNALMRLDSGCRRGSDIMTSIADYKLDIDRDTAMAAVTEINARIDAVKVAAEALKPIKFEEAWPVDAPLTLSEIMEAEAALAEATEPEGAKV